MEFRPLNADTPTRPSPTRRPASPSPGVKSGIGFNRKTEILKLSDWNSFVLREDRLSGHHIGAISKTKLIKNEIMKSLGQIAYEAYATKVDWKSPFTGQTLKEWDTLKIMNPIVAEAWECAALMVASEPPVKVVSPQFYTGFLIND